MPLGSQTTGQLPSQTGCLNPAQVRFAIVRSVVHYVSHMQCSRCSHGLHSLLYSLSRQLNRRSHLTGPGWCQPESRDYCSHVQSELSCTCAAYGDHTFAARTDCDSVYTQRPTLIGQCSSSPPSTWQHTELLHGQLQLRMPRPGAALSSGLWRQKRSWCRWCSSLSVHYEDKTA